VTSDDTRRPARLLRPLVEFLRTEAAGGVALVVAAVVALVWANSRWQQSYVDLWTHELSIGIGSHRLELDVGDWINDGLMTIFFLVVGLEIKRELVVGELRRPRRAALPALAAAGGMIAPALIYTAFNAGGPGADGWGIPVATDIAMAVGVVSLLGAAVDPSLKLFLLALAIVDDIGAIVIIAAFYSHGLDARAALIALAILAVVVGCRAGGVQAVPVYVVLGTALWLAVQQSGIHATITGVVLGLLTPTGPRRRDADLDLGVDVDVDRPASVVESLEHVLHPWSSFVIVPLFALANAGVPISRQALGEAWSSPVTHGVVAGLVLGKPIGVAAAIWLAVRLRAGELPAGASWRAVLGLGAVAGIGFTVSIFVTDLAFDDPSLRNDAIIGILAASVLAALLGALIFRLAGRRGRATGRQHWPP
jgi:NhaA family Na+:H+ antiporter